MLNGFIVPDQTHVAHEHGPEARVDQVQNGVLDAAYVLVDAAISKPVTGYLTVEGGPVVAGVGVAIKVPGGIHKCVHRVGLATGRAPALWTRCIDELRHTTQW